jgi:hypothetical protein
MIVQICCLVGLLKRAIMRHWKMLEMNGIIVIGNTQKTKTKTTTTTKKKKKKR